jgi:hypothetical protein
MKEKKQILKSVLYQKVKDAFNFAAEEESNGETAINLTSQIKNSTIKVCFNIDLGRRGIDSYNTSFVKFDKGKVSCELGDSLSGGGIEELVEEELAEFAKELIEFEVVNDSKSVIITYDTTPEDALSIIKTILADLGIKYKEDTVEDTVIIKYELPTQ